MGCSTSSAAGIKDVQGHFHDSYQLGKKLGEGAFGQVRIARERSSNKEFAVKIIDVRQMNAYGEVTSEINHERVRDTRLEINVWKQITGSSPNIVALYSTFLEENLYYMVMERCAGSLMDKLVAMPTMTDGDLSCTFRDMLLGIQHVHNCGIVHRDIKPDNFLYGSGSAKTVKLCDFGLADRLPKKGKLKGCYGTAPYMSPEMIGGNGYDQATDVWSFAAMAYLMIFGDFPYMPKEVSSPAMKQAILKGIPEPSFGQSRTSDGKARVTFSDPATDFVRALLQRNPQLRSSASTALEQSFLRPKDAQEELPLRANIKKARRLTQELKKPANVTVQRDMDDLLCKLQEKVAAGGAAAMFFSEGEGEGKEKDKSPGLEDRIVRPRSAHRHSTHSGTLSERSSEKERERDKQALGLDSLSLDTTQDSGGGPLKPAAKGPQPQIEVIIETDKDGALEVDRRTPATRASPPARSR